jgi:hypothetical protein
MSNEELVAMYYGSGPATPAGFYRDPDQTPGKSLVVACDERKCATDDIAHARQMAQVDLKNTFKKSGAIEEERTTEKYFDFLSQGIWYRVHRPSYFTWDGRSLNAALAAPPNGQRALGSLKRVPVTRAAALDFAEYHWFVSTNQMGARKVARVETRESSTHWQTILYVLWGSEADWGLTDQITLVAQIYDLDKNTGLVEVSSRQLSAFPGHYEQPPR